MSRDQVQNPVVSQVQIQDLRLRSAKVGTSLSLDDPPGPIMMDLHQDFEIEVIQEGRFSVSLTFFLDILADRESEDDDSDEEQAIAWIYPTFELTYRLPGDFTPTEEELEGFVRDSAVFNAWPYLREYAQSSLARMGLPPVILPLLRRRPAVEDSQDEGQERRAP